jgi:hypothetical protein
MPWFGKATAEPGTPTPLSLDALRREPGAGSPKAAGIQVEIEAVFWITGLGAVLTGRVRAGTVAPGMRMRLWRADSGSVLPGAVELIEVSRKAPPQRVVVVRTPQPIPLPSASSGPELLGFRARGLEKGVAKKGDMLFAKQA